MNDWQRSFESKLEAAKKQWTHRFEEVAGEHLEPVFCWFDDFTTTRGFGTSTPNCEPGTRLFKFELTENGYMLITFRINGLDTVEACTEVFVPGGESVEQVRVETHLCDVDQQWTRTRFEQALDRFVVAFGAAGSAGVQHAGQHVTA